MSQDRFWICYPQHSQFLPLNSTPAVQDEAADSEDTPGSASAVTTANSISSHLDKILRVGGKLEFWGLLSSCYGTSKTLGWSDVLLRALCDTPGRCPSPEMLSVGGGRMIFGSRQW